LDDRLARHVAAALGLHCRTLAGNGVRVPQELIDLLGACQRVSAGHSGSPLDPGADVLDGGLMQQPRAVDYTEAGRLLGVSLSSVKRLVRDGALPVVNIGGRAPRVRVADIDAFLADLAGDHRQPQETR
jgi:excisionase family DNA binding protein